MAQDPNAWLSELSDYFTPSPAHFDAAKGHRDFIERRLDADLGTYRMFEIGSLRHGTGVWLHSDADYLVSLKGSRPESSTTMLEKVRSSLKGRFLSTTISVRRPAVACYFSDGIVEIVPGYIADTDNSNHGYWIADPGGGWMRTYPEAHNAYVDRANKKHDGGAKQLARLLKVWKYERDVPISSCYLEMRAAKHLDGEPAYIPVWDVCLALNELNSHGLAAMNDPTGLSSRFTACSSEAKRIDAMSKLATAIERARRAQEYYSDGLYAQSIAQLELLFDR